MNKRLRLRIPDSETTFGQAIYWARHERGMTLRALAAAVGVSPPFQSDLEHGRRQTSKVAEYAKALGVELQDREVRQGVTADLMDWLGKRPHLIALLRDMRARRCKLLVLKGRR